MVDHKGGAQARALAARIVDTVIKRGRNLDSAFTAEVTDTLSERDRAFAKSLAFNALRGYLRSLYVLDQLLAKPLRSKDSVVQALLSTALCALFESSTPDYAVVSATVDATKVLKRPHLSGLVNAVLRSYLRERAAYDDLRAMPATARWSYPDWMVDVVRTDWPERWESILAAGNQRAPLWVRINCLRTTTADWLAELDAQCDIQAQTYSWLPGAVQLAAPLPVEELPGFAAGACSVQDAASQFAAVLLNINDSMRVLDACAAPGGKTGHMLEVGAGELVAVDSSGHRLDRVHANLARLNLAADVIKGDAHAPAEWWDGRLFDCILLDAPCSATGVIRRHPDIRFLRRPDDISKLAQQQRAMLAALWPLLKPGGRLLYSTCSILRVENEAVVNVFLTGQADAREVSLKDKLPSELAIPCDHGVQLLPGRGDTDGFYYALMERVA